VNNQNLWKNGAIRSAKEVARLAVFVATAIGSQYALSAVPFVEVVSLLFICYAFVFGVVRGVIAAVAFALLRQLLFGFYPVVLILYLVYFSMLVAVFGILPRWCKWTGWRLLLTATALAVVCTACFTLFDDLLTPLYYSYTPRAAQMYFNASIPFLIGQTICVGVSVCGLFLPLTKALFFVKKA
jgi:hypothetical protein